MHFTTPTNATAVTREMEKAIFVSGNTLERKTYLTVDEKPIVNKRLPDKYFFERSQLAQVLAICHIKPQPHHIYLTVTPDLQNQPEGYEQWIESYIFDEVLIGQYMDYILNSPKIGGYYLVTGPDRYLLEAAIRLNVSIMSRDELY